LSERETDSDAEIYKTVNTLLCVYFVQQWYCGMNCAHGCTNNLKFLICKNCKNIQHEVHKPFQNMSTFI